jgi:hypothetical protein
MPALLQFSRELEQTRDPDMVINLDIDVDIDLLWDLVHRIMEAKKCYNLPSASWRPGKPVLCSSGV